MMDVQVERVARFLARPTSRKTFLQYVGRAAVGLGLAELGLHMTAVQTEACPNWYVQSTNQECCTGGCCLTSDEHWCCASPGIFVVGGFQVICDSCPPDYSCYWQYYCWGTGHC